LWEAARYRAYRRGKRSREEIFGLLQDVIHEEQCRPWWESRRTVEQAPVKVVHRTVEELVFPLDRCSASLRRMVQAGQLPGHRWDPDRGVVRDRVALRMVG
jgi:hypothetical protein